MLSTFAQQRHWQALMMLVMLALLVLGFFVFIITALSNTVPFDEADFWITVGFCVLAAVTYFVLFQQITTTQLTFESDNRSSSIRLTCCVQFWLTWAAYLAVQLFYPRTLFDDDVVKFLAMLSTLHWSVVGLFFVTEGDYLSRRVRRGLPRNALLRMLFAPFMPGGARGYLLVLSQLVLLWVMSMGTLAVFGSASSGHVGGTGFLVGLFTFDGASWTSTVQLVTALCCYAAIFLGVGAALARWGQLISSDIRPAHARVLTILFFAAGMIAPYIPQLFDSFAWRGYHIIELSFPFTTLSHIERNGEWSSVAVLLLLLIAGIAVLINLRALVLSMTDIVTSHVKARRPQDVPDPRVPGAAEPATS
jgi:hypothetical protein